MGWVFSAVDHCHGECVGWHAVKIGDRFAALEPIAQGLTEHFGAVGAQTGRGLALRFDHGTQYMSDHFLNQLKFWGITASPAFVAEPQTNGVAERFNRTLKEQAIHGRIFRNLEEVRRAVGEFVDRYNAHWRFEKLGFLSPREARQAHALRIAA
jgi:transposase InsO family protein